MLSLAVVYGCTVPKPLSGTENQESVPELAPPFTTPDWAKGVVWYQVFPERFRDGNAQNNPNGWDLTTLDWSAAFAEPSIEEIERAWNRTKIAPRQFGYQSDRDGGALANVVYARR